MARKATKQPAPHFKKIYLFYGGIALHPSSSESPIMSLTIRASVCLGPCGGGRYRHACRLGVWLFCHHHRDGQALLRGNGAEGTVLGQPAFAQAFTASPNFLFITLSPVAFVTLITNLYLLGGNNGQGAPAQLTEARVEAPAGT